MGKASFFSKIAKALGDDEEESIEDIDREVEESVRNIQAEATVVIDASILLGNGWGEKGAIVYILNLAPIYKQIGGRASRTADNLRNTCERIFEQHKGARDDRSSIVGDHFVMCFAGSGAEKGYQKAAIVVNEVGTAILGDQFQTMEVPDILVATDAEHIINGDGQIDSGMLAHAVKVGGQYVNMAGDGDREPQWMKLEWHKNKTEPILVPIEKDPKAAGQCASREARPRREDPSQWMIRSGHDRRQHRYAAAASEERRSGIERRGRGF